MSDPNVPAAATQPPHVAARMIGREAELQRLLELFYTVAEQGGTYLVTVAGEPGVGKSRLLLEFRQWLAGLPESVLIFQGRSDAQHRHVPYGMIRSALAYYFSIQDSDQPALVRHKLEQRVAAVMGPDSAEQAHFIGHLMGFDLADSPFLRDIFADTRQIHERGLGATLQFMQALTCHHPALIIVEDLHLVDDRSLDVLEFLAHAGGDLALLIICLARLRFFEQRPQWGRNATHATRIDLHLLDAHQSRILVADILRKAGRIPTDLRNMLLNSAEGNPLFIEELVKVLIEDGVIEPRADHWQIHPRRLHSLRLPQTLSAVIASRVVAMAPAERTALERAAVFGMAFWGSAVTVDAAVPADLERRELVVAQPETLFAGEREYHFRNALVRDAIYEQITADRRRQFHADAAYWLIEQSGERADEHAGVIAGHLELAGDEQATAYWYERAAAQAYRTYAVDMARNYYRRALAGLGENPAPSSTLLRLYAGLARAQLWQGRHADALEAYTQLRSFAEQLGDTAAQTQAWVGLAHVHRVQLQPRQVLEAVAHAEMLACREDASDDSSCIALVEALIYKGWALFYLNNQAAIVVAQEALQRAEALGTRTLMAESYALLGGAYSLRDAYDQVTHYEQMALECYRTIGDRRGEAVALNNLGDTCECRGDWEGAAHFYGQSVALARQIGHRHREGFALANLARALVHTGAVAEAEQQIHEAIRLSEHYGQTSWAFAYIVLAEVCLAQENLIEAQTAAQRALDLARQEATESDAAQAWRVLGMVMARLPEHSGAPACFAESVRICAAIGLESERARTLRAWADYEVRHGAAERGHALRQEARAIFERLGLTLELQRTDERA